VPWRCEGNVPEHCVAADGVARWFPVTPLADLEVPDLSAKGRERILAHATRCSKELPAILSKHGLKNQQPSGHHAEIRIGNSFPAGVGIASSASSFAALTLAMGRAHGGAEFEALWKTTSPLRRDLARLSKLGSGSSGRSMEGPWIQWDGDAIETVPSKIGPVVDHVLVVDREPKAVGSSQAHERVRTSPLWSGRPERALQRCFLVKEALAVGNWAELCRHVWQEAWEMHSLFHTATPPFTYWKPQSLEVLNALEPLVHGSNPPLVTMDAGPNVHILVQEADASIWAQKLRGLFPNVELLSDRCGEGAHVL
jgi:diphosphomevalonate decarboxylase